MNSFFRSVISKIKEIAMSEDVREESAPAPRSSAAKENTQPVRPAAYKPAAPSPAPKAVTPKKQGKSMYKSVIGESTMYFWDPAGKFDAVKDEAFEMCRRKYDLTIYSLTPKGMKDPSRLILKMTPAGDPDSYLSTDRPDFKQANIGMLSLDYQTVPADQLKRTCKYLANTFLSKSLMDCTKSYVYFAQCAGENGNIRDITLADFFGIDPLEDEPGAQIYLRDKAHFLSMLPDPKNPAFAARLLLTVAQKAEVTSFDLTGADVCNRRCLNSLFSGYTSIRRLDLSPLNVPSVTEMNRMFLNCRSLQCVDMSAFDMSRVTDMRSMFSGCPALEEVIFPESVLRAYIITRVNEKITSEELNAIYRSEYIAAGPQLAEMAAKRAESIKVSFGEATKKELYECLGLAPDQRVKFTFVPQAR